MAQIIQGPWKPNLKELLERETDRLCELIARYKDEQAQKKEGGTQASPPREQ
jgi:hypothetical protein